MSGSCFERPPAKEAPAELLLLQKWEEFTTWFLCCTGRFPKCVRFTVTQRLENHALDVTELLVLARYRRDGRQQRLDEVNLRLERMRLLLRVALSRNALPKRSFEAAVRKIDEAGRMLYGWRQSLAGAASPREKLP
jgi:hypothetical protein